MWIGDTEPGCPSNPLALSRGGDIYVYFNIRTGTLFLYKFFRRATVFNTKWRRKLLIIKGYWKRKNIIGKRRQQILNFLFPSKTN
jgi:hypothetical protein